jgi:hypothetical protein
MPMAIWRCCEQIGLTVDYVIDAFEPFARRWMELVDRHGGTHHGYFLPADESGCVLRYQRTFMRPFLPGPGPDGAAP